MRKHGFGRNALRPAGNRLGRGLAACVVASTWLLAAGPALGAGGAIGAGGATGAGGAGEARGGAAAELLAAMDPAADPCQDFYRYACGGWLDRTTIPPDKGRWIRSFSVLDDHNRELLRTLLEDAAAHPGADPDRARVGDFYGACMDEAAVERAGLSPIQPLLDAAARMKPSQALALAGRMQRQGIPVFFNFGALPDAKDPGRQIAILFQGGLGLPDRDYYLSAEPKKKQLLASYQQFVARMLGLSGESAAAAARHAARIVTFETLLALASRPADELRDPEALYHRLDLAGLRRLTPALDWPGFLSGLGFPGITQINVATPEFFRALAIQLRAADGVTLREYLRWHTLLAFAGALPAAFVNAEFELMGRQLAGQREIAPRWKRCVAATEEALGEAVGKLYVERAFSAESKQAALEMIHDVEAAFAANLPNLAWMDDATRASAIAKKDAIVNHIGYPDTWRDYGALSITRERFLDNARAAAEHELVRQLSRVGGAVDRQEWRFTPQTVNAAYNPSRNDITFPAGILQPPFFSKDFPAAVNYGAIGTVIGHELTHGFDDEGRKFDAEGRLRQWWQPEVSQRFEERAQCMRDQYSGYEVEAGVAVNGKLTAGENIADNGGLEEAYLAYKEWEKRNGGPGPGLDGLTADQLFFIGHAQVWCALTTPETARLRVTVDVHAPPRFRVLGPIANHPAFGAAFQCPAGTPMNPPRKCEVW